MCGLKNFFHPVLILAILWSSDSKGLTQSLMVELDGSAEIFQNYLRDEMKSFEASNMPVSLKSEASFMKLLALPGISMERSSRHQPLRLKVSMPPRRRRADQWIAESQVLYQRAKNEMARQIQGPQLKNLSEQERLAWQLQAWALLASGFEESFKSVYLNYYAVGLASP